MRCSACDGVGHSTCGQCAGEGYLIVQDPVRDPLTNEHGWIHIDCNCGRQPVPCDECHGDGEIGAVEAVFQHNQCGVCGGTGQQRCSVCGGDGHQIVFGPRDAYGEHPMVTITCETCLGHGTHGCGECNGDGQIGVVDYLTHN